MERNICALRGADSGSHSRYRAALVEQGDVGHMGQVNAMSSTVVTAAPDKVLAALSDYETIRPRILSEQYLTTRSSKVARVTEPSRSGRSRRRKSARATSRRQ